MRSLAKILLIAALLLLGFASAASANCAWVLWGSYTRASDAEDVYYPVSAFESKAECEEGANKKNETSDRRAKNNPGQYSKGASSLPLYQCWPPALDLRLRGPKSAP